MRPFTIFVAFFCLNACSTVPAHMAEENGGDELTERRAATQVTVTLSPVTPEEGIALRGTTTLPVSTFDVQAKSEDMVATRFTLEVAGDFEAVTSVFVTYQDKEGRLNIATAAVGADGLAEFTGQNLLIPMNAPVQLKAYTEQSLTGTPGGSFQVNWTNVRFRAVGSEYGVLYGPRTTTSSVEALRFEYHATLPTVTRSALSPSGAAEEPKRMEILRHLVGASVTGDLGLTSKLFKLTTSDNAGSGWNTCGQLTPSKLDLYNLTLDGTSQTLETSDDSWTLYNADGFKCQPGEVVAYARVDFKDEVPAAMSYSYSLYLDATGASALLDDTIHATVEDVTWTDAGYMKPFTGELVNDIPLDGGTNQF